METKQDFIILKHTILSTPHYSSRHSLYLLWRTPPQQDVAAVWARNCVLVFIINFSMIVQHERINVGAGAFAW